MRRLSALPHVGLTTWIGGVCLILTVLVVVLLSNIFRARNNVISDYKATSTADCIKTFDSLVQSGRLRMSYSNVVGYCSCVTEEKVDEFSYEQLLELDAREKASKPTPELTPILRLCTQRFPPDTQ